jgi:hypothetical protein
MFLITSRSPRRPTTNNRNAEAKRMESATVADVDRRRMFGLALDSWNNLIVWLAGFAGGFAVLAAIATFIAFQLQKQEATDAANALSRYKIETGERIAEADARASEANARGADANQKAEQERIERLKLEAKFAPRFLNDAEAGEFAAGIASLTGVTIDIVSYEGLGPDVAVLSNQLAKIMRNVGIDARVFTPMGGSGLIRGISVRNEIGSGAQVDAAVNQIVRTLSAVGLSASRMEQYPAGEVIAGGYMGPTGVFPNANLRVLVGAKPQ